MRACKRLLSRWAAFSHRWRCVPDIHLLSSGVVVDVPGAATRQLSFDSVIPRSTRGAILSTYILGVPCVRTGWVADVESFTFENGALGAGGTS